MKEKKMSEPIKRKDSTPDHSTDSIHLDAMINKVSYVISQNISDNKDRNKLKNQLERCSGILSINGVYAFYIYAKKEDLWGNMLRNQFYSLKNFLPCKEMIEIHSNNNEKADHDYFSELTENMNDLLFVKDIFEKILVYTRYHLKAMDAVEGE